MRSAVLSLAFLWLLILCGSGAAEAPGQEGKIDGESFVNLRSGPDVRYPSKAILKKGEEVSVEKEEGGWYFVELPDGRKGYVHKTLVALLKKEEPQPSVQQEGERGSAAQEPAAAMPGDGGKKNARSAAGKTGKDGPGGKPLPLIKLLEGREGDILPWLGAALCVFVIGWICGGNYYLRRDRIRRTKLHF